MSDSNSSFAFKMLIFAMVVMFTLPVMITNFVPQVNNTIDEEELLQDYYSFTGSSQGHTAEAVWVLTGIYTPYMGENYGYTDDGWLYGSRVQTNSPTQYRDSPYAFTVYRDESGYYRYYWDSADYDADKGTGYKGTYRPATEEDVENNDKLHKGDPVKQDTIGDQYTRVVFDSAQKSNIFFTSAGKHNSSGGAFDSTVGDDKFYYEFTGYRYAFQPLSNIWAVDGDGNRIQVVATTTSLSLIWYQYYTQSGISGQLVLTGSDSGVAYINGDQIVKKFNSTTNTARFPMTFNGGVQMFVTIKLDPHYLSQGVTVKDCYDFGYWSIMVTSLSTDTNAYTGTDFSLDIEKIFTTIIDLMTFNYTKYGMSDMMGAICSFIIIIPLYAGLIALALSSWEALIITGIFLVIQSLATVVTNWGGWFGGLF